MNMNKVRTVVACTALIYLQKKRRRRVHRNKRIWVKLWIKERENCGIVNNLLSELRREDEAFYANFLRMSVTDFAYLLEKVYSLIKKQDTCMRPAIPPVERLVLTLRFLATGDSYQSLMYLFRIPTCTISRIIPEVCQAIFEALKDEYLKVPSTEAEWEEIASDYNRKWNFPNCIGALDGKHVNIKAPSNCGSLYFNYKGVHSIVWMALADANYKITYINVGSTGRNSDGGVFQDCALSTALENNTLNIPCSHPLPGRIKPIPFVILADDAFPLKPYIMKPFAFRNQSLQERVFNYRLSRGRRIIENVFGITSARFRVLRRTIELSPKKVKILVCAISALHNFLISRSTRLYAPQGTFDIENENGTIIAGNWRSDTGDLHPLPTCSSRNSSTDAKNIRNEFKEYFCYEGEIPWQYRFI